MNPIRTSNEIGAAIRTERKRQGLTELAKALTVLITLGLDVYLAKRGE